MIADARPTQGGETTVLSAIREVAVQRGKHHLRLAPPCEIV
jgi:hypothetical protein